MAKFQDGTIPTSLRSAISGRVRLRDRVVPGCRAVVEVETAHEMRFVCHGKWLGQVQQVFRVW